MGKFKTKRNKKRNKDVTNTVTTKTRKDIRKEKRNLKKVNKQNYFSKSEKRKNFQEEIGKYVRFPKTEDIEESTVSQQTKLKKHINDTSKSFDSGNIIMKENKGAKAHEEKLKDQMKNQRNSQLLKANIYEDKIIKKLEKQLKIKKKKSGNIAKSFESDGLGYLLEVCDSSTMAAAVAAEKHLVETGSGSDFEEDVAIATGNSAYKQKTKNKSLLEEKHRDYSDTDKNMYDDSDSDESHDSLDQQDQNIRSNYNLCTKSKKPPVVSNSMSKNKSDNCSNLSDDLNSCEEENSSINDFEIDEETGENLNVAESHSEESIDEELMDEELDDEELDDEELDDEELDYEESDDDENEDDLELLYSGLSDFPDESFHPGKLTPVIEETELDLDLYQNNVNTMLVNSTLNTTEDSLQMNLSMSDNDSSEESYSEESDVDNSFQMDSDDSGEMNSDDAICSHSHNESNRQIIVNGKVINTYNRDIIDNTEPKIVRCPILDKILDNLSESESDIEPNLPAKDEANSFVRIKTKADKSKDQKKVKRKIDDKIIQKENLPKPKKTRIDTEAESSITISKNKNKLKEKEKKDNNAEGSKSDTFLSDDDSILDIKSDSELGQSDSSDNSNASIGNKNHGKNNDEPWEDIYGRKRDSQGNVINEQSGKYIPPHLRMKDNIDDTKEMILLKRQLKGLLNKVASSNMHWTSSQIENIYNSNSRNAVNHAFCSLWMAALVQPTPTPSRMAAEHAMLVAVLHANIGSEIGAHFLQTVVKKFDEMYSELKLGNKELENLVLGISHLYNFKIFQSSLLYEILDKLVEKLSEKTIECLLVSLRTVGAILRKDNPAALKTFIQTTQEKASHLTEKICDRTRVKFLLDVLMAIKNNNMSKIPNYDPSYSEELIKSMKGIVRKGNYVVSLNINLDDLLNASERGRWWVVGSAWEGKNEPGPASLETPSTDTSQKPTDIKQTQLLELARQQRINTDLRKNIFCIIMSAEDYMDAFEKLQQLGLKNQQEREIIHVLLACNLQEKIYNPYYAVLAQKYCDYDRKFQMSIQYSVWDKIKEINDCSAFQISNLAQFVTHLFLEKGLPISILKVVEFSDLTKPALRFMRQILLAILLHKNWKTCLEVFQRVAVSPKLHLFRESLRLFINHFLVKKSNKKDSSLDEDKINLLKERASAVDRTLQSDSKLQF